MKKNPYIVKFRSRKTGNKWKEIALLHSRYETALRIKKDLLKANAGSVHKLDVSISSVDLSEPKYKRMTILH